MKQRLLFLLLFAKVTCFAQNERSNWFMGTFLGMKFTNNVMSIVPANTTPSYAPYASASYSNPATGALMLYTNGSYVYNRQHQQMLNGFYINDETFGIHSVIVPHPGNKNLFYIISSASAVSRLYYATVDMRLQGGLGNVTDKAKVLDNNADLPFCVVKQLYDEGYWLITHTAASNQFRTYRIGKNGLDTNAVISAAGSVSASNARYVYGKMVSNSTGERFVFTHGWTDITGKCEEFLFDKKCGTVSFGQSFYAHPLQAQEQFAYPAYSSDDSKLYVSWIYNSGQSLLLQYNLKDAFPNSSYVIIKNNMDMNGDMQLAPDGKIYIASSENSAVTPKVSVIHNPNVLGIACNHTDKSVVLASSSGGSYYLEHFPEFIMDVSPQKPGFEKPVLVFANLCENQPVSLSIKVPIQADSVRWDLGDGTVASTPQVTHQYSALGDYPVSFNWFMCGHKYFILDTLKLRSTPQVNLGRDSTLCAGNTIVLSYPNLADEFRWNTGDSTASIWVNKAGVYSLKVRNGSCWGEDKIDLSYYDQIWTTLGDEYFICDDEKELVKLDAGKDFVQYKWTPTGDTTQWIIVGNVADYFVVVKDYRGCSGEDGTKVKRRCPVNVFYPNAFTPNEDGTNDVYLPIGKDVVDYKLSIYNAWGQQVFETQSLQQGWDGSYQGKPAPIGTYTYQSTYSGYRNKRLVYFDIKGNITLLR